MLLRRSAIADGVIRSVPENQANANVGTILVVTGVDAGITLNNSHYNFRNTGRDFASFRLTAVANGVRLVTRNALDYETQTDYEVTITVRDGRVNDNDGRPASAIDDEITVIINVGNDETDDDAVTNREPVFGAGPSTTRSVPENTDPGENIDGVVCSYGY